MTRAGKHTAHLALAGVSGPAATKKRNMPRGGVRSARATRLLVEKKRGPTNWVGFGLGRVGISFGSGGTLTSAAHASNRGPPNANVSVMFHATLHEITTTTLAVPSRSECFLYASKAAASGRIQCLAITQGWSCSQPVDGLQSVEDLCIVLLNMFLHRI